MQTSHLARVCYIHHSAFAVETSTHLLIVDYYAPGVGGREQIQELLRLAGDRRVVVLASHGHGDHFSNEVFSWDSTERPVTYVLSEDIRTADVHPSVQYVTPGHTYEIDGLRIRTLKSTDLGVAFLVTCDGLTIYHAGDLNWWHWEGEPEEDNKVMAEDYKKQIDLLRGEQIDLAFIPVDPRLEEQYDWGLKYLLDQASLRMIFPMHFGLDYSIFEALRRDMAPADFARVSVISPESLCFSYPVK
jgi:L-ascorbate metabolism protein UlaG (beta-lactamase superfamily)